MNAASLPFTWSEDGGEFGATRSLRVEIGTQEYWIKEGSNGEERIASIRGDATFQTIKNGSGIHVSAAANKRELCRSIGSLEGIRF
jgi:hypothetical protein